MNFCCYIRRKLRFAIWFLPTVQPRWVERRWMPGGISFQNSRHTSTCRGTANSGYDKMQPGNRLWWSGSTLYALKANVLPLSLQWYNSSLCKPVTVICMVTNHVLDLIYETHGHRILRWNNELLSPAKLEVYANTVSRAGAPPDNWIIVSAL